MAICVSRQQPAFESKTLRTFTLWDALLAFGLLLSFETQFRVSKLPLGPGEALIVMWLIKVLSARRHRPGAILPQPTWDLARFWAWLAVALCFGVVVALVRELPVDWAASGHDIFAYALVATLSFALTASANAYKRMVTIQWMAVVLGVVLVWLQIANAFGWFAVPGVDPWFWERMRGWCDNPNQFALMGLSVGFLALALYESTNTVWAKIAALCLCAVALTGGSHSLSNALLGASTAGLAAFGGLKLCRALVRLERRGQPAVRVALFLASATGLAICLAAPAIGVRADSRTILDAAARSGREGADEDAAQRVMLWQDAISKGADSYTLGFGPGPHLRKPPQFHGGDLHPGLAPNFEAHNTPLELFTQGGFLAIAALAWIFALAVYRSWKSGADGTVALFVALASFSGAHVVTRHPMVWFAISLGLVQYPHARKYCSVLSAADKLMSPKRDGMFIMRPMRGERPRTDSEIPGMNVNPYPWPPQGVLSDGLLRPIGGATAEAASGLDLRRALAQVRRRIVLVVAVLALGTALSVAAALLSKPSYMAIALIAVNLGNDDSSTGRLIEDPVDTQVAMLLSSIFMNRAYEAISRDRRLAAAVGSAKEFERRLTVQQQGKSRLIDVTFTAKSPVVAADVANTVARLYVEDPSLQAAGSVDDVNQALLKRIAKLEETIRGVQDAAPTVPSSASGSPANADLSELRQQLAELRLREALAHERTASRERILSLSPLVQLVALAEPPERPSSINPFFLLIPGSLASAILGVTLAMLLGSMDDRLYLASDLVGRFSVPFAGAVPALRRRAARANSLDAGYLRAMDAVIARTLLMRPSESATVFITTSVLGENSSQFAADFATAAARLGRRLLLIDMDPAHPPTGRSPQQGVFDALSGLCDAKDLIYRPPGLSFDRIDCGVGRDPDVLPLIAAGGLQRLLVKLRPSYDWMILKGPPVLGFSETSLAAANADTVLLVIRSGQSRSPDVTAALEALAASVSSERLRKEPPEVFAVLADAPRPSLPAPFRDLRIATSLSCLAPETGECRDPEAPSGAMAFRD